MYSLSSFFAGEKNSCVYYIQNEIKITLHIKKNCEILCYHFSLLQSILHFQLSVWNGLPLWTPYHSEITIGNGCTKEQGK